MRTEAISIDRGLLQKWQTGSQGLVHSVHSRAIYLRDNGGSLCCLTSASEADGPEIARVAADAFAMLTAIVRQGDWYVAGAAGLQLSQAQVSFADSSVWDGALPAFPPADKLEVALAIIKTVLVEHGRPGGLKYLFQPPPSQEIVTAALCQRAGRLLSALKQRRFDEARSHGLSLLGLGGGLSPSGDDFLAALITVFYMPQGPFPEVCRATGKSWAFAAKTATTAIGTFLLRIAAQGRAREPVNRFLAAVATGDYAAIQNSAQTMLLFGASSGTDWLAGLAAGLEAGLALY